MGRLKNYFRIYRNGNLVGETHGASLKEAKSIVRTGKVSIGTHMGEWRRAPTGYRYHTTVGVTVDFVRFARPYQEVS
jgi:hypothetical protein